VYLAEAEIPLARGGFRQDDFPQSELLADEVGPGTYRAWLRELGVRYVVLTRAPTDYSARGEARLLRSGDSGLRRVFTTSTLAIYELPRPTPILRGAGQPRVLRLTATRIKLDLPRPGTYRLAVRYSPYWRAENACLLKRLDGMTTVEARAAGPLELSFHVSARRALATAVVGARSRVCDTS
jgi:hypothetical protein